MSDPDIQAAQANAQVAIATASSALVAIAALTDRVLRLEHRTRASPWISAGTLPIPPNGRHHWFLDNVPWGSVYCFTVYPLLSPVGNTFPDRELIVTHYILQKGIGYGPAAFGEYQLNVVVENPTPYPTPYEIDFIEMAM